jgi:hypothetical protein
MRLISHNGLSTRLRDITDKSIRQPYFDDELMIDPDTAATEQRMLSSTQA